MRVRYSPVYNNPPLSNEVTGNTNPSPRYSMLTTNMGPSAKSVPGHWTQQLWSPYQKSTWRHGDKFLNLHTRVHTAAPLLPMNAINWYWDNGAQLFLVYWGFKFTWAITHARFRNYEPLSQNGDTTLHEIRTFPPLKKRGGWDCWHPRNGALRAPLRSRAPSLTGGPRGTMSAGRCAAARRLRYS